MLNDTSKLKLRFEQAVLLVGGGELHPLTLSQYAERGWPIVAADGGANHLRTAGIIPHAIIGDMDSVEYLDDLDTQLIHLSEQDTTDFEKCLYSIDAPMFVAIGFTGLRVDHTLGAIHVMARYHQHKEIVLVNAHEAIVVASGILELDGVNHHTKTISVAPLQQIEFQSSFGLAYPLDGLNFEFGKQIGTSNQINEDIVRINPATQYMQTPYLVSVHKDLAGQFIERMLQA